MKLEKKSNASNNYTKLEEILKFLKFSYFKSKLDNYQVWDEDYCSYIKYDTDLIESSEYKTLRDFSYQVYDFNIPLTEDQIISEEEASMTYERNIVESNLKFFIEEYEYLLKEDELAAKNFKAAIDFIGNDIDLLFELRNKYAYTRETGILETDIENYLKETDKVLLVNNKITIQEINSIFLEKSKEKSKEKKEVIKDFLIIDPILFINELERILEFNKFYIKDNFFFQCKNEELANIIREYFIAYDNVKVLTKKEVESSETKYDFILKSDIGNSKRKENVYLSKHEYNSMLKKLKEEGNLGIITESPKLISDLIFSKKLRFLSKIILEHNKKDSNNKKTFYLEINNLENTEVKVDLIPDCFLNGFYTLDNKTLARDLEDNFKFLCTISHKKLSVYESSHRSKKTLKILSKDIFHGKAVKKDETSGIKNISVLNISNINGKKIDYQNVSRIRNDIKKFRQYELEDGDILLVARGNAREYAIYNEKEAKDHLIEIKAKEYSSLSFEEKIKENEIQYGDEQIVIASSNIIVIRLKKYVKPEGTSDTKKSDRGDNYINPELFKLFLEKTDWGKLYLEKASIGEKTKFININVIAEMVIPVEALKDYYKDLEKIKIELKNIEEKFNKNSLPKGNNNSEVDISSEDKNNILEDNEF